MGQCPDHEHCSGTMSKPSHYIEPRHQFPGWVTSTSPLRDLSLLWEDGPSHSCHFTTPLGISAQRRRVVRTVPTPSYKNQISSVPFYSSMIHWGLIHVTLRLQDPQVRMIKEKQKWLCPSSLCNHYIICPKACLFFTQPASRQLHSPSFLW